MLFLWINLTLSQLFLIEDWSEFTTIGASPWTLTLEHTICCIPVFTLEISHKSKHLIVWFGLKYYWSLCCLTHRPFVDDVFRCGIVQVVAEIDRVLRPGGYLVLQDTMETIKELESILGSLHWSTKIYQDRFLVGRKGFWRPIKPELWLADKKKNQKQKKINFILYTMTQPYYIHIKL